MSCIPPFVMTHFTNQSSPVSPVSPSRLDASFVSLASWQPWQKAICLKLDMENFILLVCFLLHFSLYPGPISPSSLCQFYWVHTSSFSPPSGKQEAGLIRGSHHDQMGSCDGSEAVYVWSWPNEIPGSAYCFPSGSCFLSRYLVANVRFFWSPTFDATVMLNQE